MQSIPDYIAALTEKPEYMWGVCRGCNKEESQGKVGKEFTWCWDEKKDKFGNMCEAYGGYCKNCLKTYFGLTKKPGKHTPWFCCAEHQQNNPSKSQENIKFPIDFVGTVDRLVSLVPELKNMTLGMSIFVNIRCLCIVLGSELTCQNLLRITTIKAIDCMPLEIPRLKDYKACHKQVC